MIDAEFAREFANALSATLSNETACVQAAAVHMARLKKL
jgi:hypothetical protein